MIVFILASLKYLLATIRLKDIALALKIIDTVDTITNSLGS